MTEIIRLSDQDITALEKIEKDAEEFSEKKLELNINEKTAVTFNLSLPEKYRDYLYFLPAPLSGIFWLIGLIP